LPASTLCTLARARTPAELVAELSRLEHWAAPVLATSDRDLLGFEQGLARAFARRALDGARAADDAAVTTHVAQVIDAENAGAALLVAARGRELDPAASFLDGGNRVSREVFFDACRGDHVRLARALAGTALASALAGTGFEDAALAWHLETQARLRRTDPTGLAAVLLLVLSRRRERRIAQRTRWRAILGGAP
jgi:hypothetical protein